ncbi:CDP-diacylglycerol---serine O-phosphatidyltransferase [Terrimicrobium sacchariphilum]|jgi:CDP-diacylglycerol--serine O-phosphatidyltransferase|uniref:CDP-diacylglycerol--serine O-phosphatidyltransferase n=1 Tax=Terrimicrobium sacchariphilum TaxID=690879 RepID=A0A146G375_TERSA|nr:CDP-diacylglycerol--serine O-phosphatidyltransferase [Terrimicrobium sacchariphilum]GAT31932.1 CDP-diacylglycerol---serine O-phosphatidyltransferase [Terrimicrobium sacchariphilum]
MTSPREPKVYLLPNLMTAGNLFCGFAAVLRLIEAALILDNGGSVVAQYHQAILFILGACVFDLLDGRLARLGGSESAFGREFDSIADIVSFGVAPALMVYQMVLRDFEGNIGWLIAFVYLLCGALRLARFNCYAQAKQPNDPPSDEFVGFPIPAAAGLIASLTLFMLWLQEGERTIGQWKYALAALMLFLSFMMFSHVRYPSFKGLGWRSQRSIPRFLLIIVIIVFSAVNYQWMPALMFVLFLIYGFVRPFISKAWRREIEEDEGDHPEITPGNGK